MDGGISYFKIAEIAAPIPNAVVGGPFGSNLGTRDYIETGVPVIRGTNLSDGRWVSGDFVFVSEKKAAQLATNIAHPGDIILTQRGTLGQVAIAPDEPYDRYIVSQSQMKLTVDPEKIDVLYLYYYFLSAEYREYLNQHTIQTGVPHINLSILRETLVPVPPLPVQRRIAQILGRLDDKIEGNRRINRTLEAMARALYRHWFVDFGPFQDGAFVESELGLIPRGWEVRTLGEIATNVKQTVSPQGIEGTIPYIGLADMPKGSITLDMWGKAEDSSSSKFIMKKGQILFGKLRPYFKKVGIAPVDGVCSTDILVIEPKEPEYFGLVLTLLIQQDFIDYTDAVSSGTRMPRVNWKMMAAYPVVIPEKSVARRFTDYIRAWSLTIIHNIEENARLVETRDYLLPRLLSGEVEVL